LRVLTPLDVRLLDHRQQGPVDAPAGLQQGREEAAHPQLGDLELETAHPGVQRLGAVAVAVGGPIGGALVRVGADHRAGLDLDQALNAVLEDQPQLVAIGEGQLVEEFLVCHPGAGHSWISLKVEHSKENPTVAFSVYPVRSGPEKASISTTVRDITRAVA